MLARVFDSDGLEAVFGLDASLDDDDGSASELSAGYRANVTEGELVEAIVSVVFDIIFHICWCVACYVHSEVCVKRIRF